MNVSSAPTDAMNRAHTPLASAELLVLMQLADSSFPMGGFSFSSGLEGLLQLGAVTTEADIAAFARVQIEEGLTGVEFPAIRHAHVATLASDLDRLFQIDEMLTALKPVPAFRSASLRVGRRFVESAEAVLDAPMLSAYRTAICTRPECGHLATAWAVAFAAVSLDSSVAALTFGSSSLHGFVAAGVRLGLIGQASAQRLIGGAYATLIEAVEQSVSISLDEMGGYAPMIDIAGLRQPALDGRLFAS